MRTKSNETCDSIKEIKLFQSKTGYRFSVDALLLEDFIAQNWWEGASKTYKGIEFGTGSGVVAMLLAKRFKNARITASEIQKGIAERAGRNVELNKLGSRVDVINEDIKCLTDVFPPGRFDFAFSNPPFRKAETGRLSADEERAIARHEIKINLPDIIESASYLIKNSGKFYLIYHPFRLVELFGLLKKARLEPKKMRFVHSRIGKEAKMVLIEAVKGSGAWLKIEAPLYIYENDNEYTYEMKKIYGEG
ncbi:MAG: tRNA1(Val) (adenine(37)-N6)-methyltransferase [Nitrospirae bacterium]|nr:tRNA1(Val) (adenine(37)-N6)-methyltransferase [Nitrospirota bacterium]